MFKYFRIYWLQLLLNLVNSGFTNILLFHFYKQHVALSDIFFADAIGCAVNVTFILLRREIRTRRDMRLGFGVMALAMLFLITIPFSKPVFYLFYALQTIGTILFYVPLNILYFQGVDAGARMRGMTWYWIVGIVAGVVGPLVGAYLFAATGLTQFMLVPLVILAFAMWLVRYAPQEIITYSRENIFTRLRGMRTLTMLDGALHRVNGDTASFALLFIATVVDYGKYLSFVSLVMAAVAWFVAAHSDKTNKRMRYLWPSAAVAAAATIAFAGVHSFTPFLILILVARAALIIAEPLRSNVQQDILEPHAHNWISREFYLNSGRAMIQIVAAGLLALGVPVAAFILFGFMHIAFPIMLHYKNLYKTV